MRRRKEKEHQAQGPPARSAESAGPGGAPRRLTPVDIQQKEFRGARWGRGYNEGEVDQFLDEVTEEVARLHAENKRLHEDLEYRGTARLQTDPAVEADAIVRQAHDEADRILADAELRARSVPAERDQWQDLQAPEGAAGGGGSFRPAVTETPEWKSSLGRFLSREKEFLQRLAGLIQQHAEGVKEDAQRTRDEWAGVETADVPPSPAAAVLDEGATAQHDAEPLIDLTDEGPPPESDVEPAGGEGHAVEASEASLDEFEPGADDWNREGEEPESVAEEWHEPAAPSMAARSNESTEASASSEDRSIRELFWGED